MSVFVKHLIFSVLWFYDGVQKKYLSKSVEKSGGNVENLL